MTYNVVRSVFFFVLVSFHVFTFPCLPFLSSEQNKSSDNGIWQKEFLGYKSQTVVFHSPSNNLSYDKVTLEGKDKVYIRANLPIRQDLSPVIVARAFSKLIGTTQCTQFMFR